MTLRNDAFDWFDVVNHKVSPSQMIDCFFTRSKGFITFKTRKIHLYEYFIKIRKQIFNLRRKLSIKLIMYDSLNN